jgi:hypothetical protein
MKSKTITIMAMVLVGVLLALPSAGQAQYHGGGGHYHGGGGWYGGWYGAGLLAGGLLLGAALTAPRYPQPVYAYPAPQVVYVNPPRAQAYAYPPPPEAAYAPQNQQQSHGEWVVVPSQRVGNQWVPSHKVWVADE